MNRKAFELAISTLILIILGVLVLIALTIVLTGGLERFKSSTKPFLDTAQSSSIKQACSLACDSQDRIIYCCNEYSVDSQKIKCSDSRLELSCELNCQGFNCEAQ
ncbi:hypothetical protein HYV50_01140 [Candidatus Pacearchaeota archaeon]|nr:hypothetical protein [Candidatus Pacearchaeota archaeon]